MAKVECVRNFSGTGVCEINAQTTTRHESVPSPPASPNLNVAPLGVPGLEEMGVYLSRRSTPASRRFNIEIWGRGGTHKNVKMQLGRLFHKHRSGVLVFVV